MKAWHEQARRLAAEHPDWSHARIAAEFGVTASAVWKALNPDKTRELLRAQNARRRDAKRAWERQNMRRPENRATCELCGLPCGIGQPNARRCHDCIMEIAVTRESIVAGMYLDGWTLREISQALGYAESSSAGAVLHRMRRLGWDLPYRHADYDTEQVAA